MRKFNEVIAVRDGLESDAGAREMTMDFVWRGRLWRVTEVLAQWRETGPWWEHATAALHGDSTAGQELAEQVVWRVQARSGMYGHTGVYELAHHHLDGQWRVRAVMD